MEFVVFCAASFVFTLTLCVFSQPLRTLSSKARRVRAIAESGATYTGELEGSIFQRLFGPLVKKLRADMFKKRSRQGKVNAANEKREKQLRGAGIYIGASAFIAMKYALALVLVGASLLIVTRIEAEDIIKLLIILASAMLALLLPDYAVKLIGNSRRDSMKKQLPDLMDILSVSIDAGLGFDAALKRALDKFTGALKEELTVASMEISMGKARRDALMDMAERCDIGELRILVAAIVQSEQMGTPIKNVLKAQSAQLRANRKQAAQEKGMKAPVKMMLPMVAFIFPVLLIILMGPTVMNIVEAFG